MSNSRKRFEEDSKSSIDNNENWVYRLRDNAVSSSGGTNTRFTSTNIRDFLIFNNKHRTLYLTELKPTKGSSISYTMIKDNQTTGLSEAGKYNAIPCFFFNFREKNNTTYFMVTDDFINMKRAPDKKSFDTQDLEKHGAISVLCNIKRTHYRYDIETLIKQIHTQKNFMITLIKMKLKEWKIELALYTVIEKLITEQKDITALLSDLYVAPKDAPFNELKDEFIMKLADIIHDQAEVECNVNISIKED